jgi:hypothetical protein
MSSEVRVNITITYQTLLYPNQRGYHDENYSLYVSGTSIVDKNFTNQLLTTIGYNWAEVEKCSTNKNNCNPD